MYSKMEDKYITNIVKCDYYTDNIINKNDESYFLVNNRRHPVTNVQKINIDYNIIINNIYI